MQYSIENVLSEAKNALDRFIENRRPPIELRHQLDIGYKIEGQSIYIFEIRPDYFNEGSKIEPPIAKATYVKSHRLWKIFWMRADLRWHLYEPNPYVFAVNDFIEIIDDDKLGCFWG